MKPFTRNHTNHVTKYHFVHYFWVYTLFYKNLETFESFQFVIPKSATTMPFSIVLYNEIVKCSHMFR